MPADQDSPRPDVAQALVREATRKSSLVWLTYAGADRARPAWHVWHGDAAYVVASRTDDDFEQLLPGLAEAGSAVVTCRAKDSRARLVSWRANVETLTPGTTDWHDAAAALRGQRLNASQADPRAERWAADAVLVRLTPTGELLEEPGRMPSDDASAPPPASPATTTGRLPWVLHKRARRGPRLS